MRNVSQREFVSAQMLKRPDAQKNDAETREYRMGKISGEIIEYVGILARLELSEKEKKAARKDMEKMLQYIDKLNELDTKDTEPMTHIFPIHNVFREDVVANGDDREKILANAPKCKDGAFQVPKTVE